VPISQKDKTPDWSLLIHKKRIIVAFSGGVDSTFLLWEIVNHFGKDDCIAVYFNHGLRPQDEQLNELKIVKNTIQVLGVRGVIRRLPLRAYAQKYGTGAEEAGRYLRYDLLAHFRKIFHCDAIVTAHHQDDAAESLLMQLGTGALFGTRGIPNHTQWRQKTDIYHPLWPYTKADIITAFKNIPLQHSEDSSNTNTAMLRNQLRHNLIPEAEKAFPEFSQKLLRFGSFMGDINAYIAAKIPASLLTVSVAQDVAYTHALRINLKGFEALHTLEKEWLARHWLQQQGQSEKHRLSRPSHRFSHTHIHAIIAVASGRVPRTSLPDNRMAWHAHGALYFSDTAVSPVVVFTKQTLLIKEGESTLSPGLLLTITCEKHRPGKPFPEKWKKPWIACFPSRLIPEGTTLRLSTRTPRLRFQPLGMHQDISLKRYLIHRKFPEQWRGHLPLFFLGSELVWVPFLGIANRFQTKTGEPHSEAFSEKEETLWVLTLSPRDDRFQPVFNHYNWM
jgi:tRNA(Ile)-lysidine synthetase-like protein